MAATAYYDVSYPFPTLMQLRTSRSRPSSAGVDLVAALMAGQHKQVIALLATAAIKHYRDFCDIGAGR